MNILLTSAGRRSYIISYFKEVLGNKGLVHAGNSHYSTALDCSDRYVITPPIYSKDYIDFLMDYCKLHDINMILPLFDIDLLVLSKSKERFSKEGISIIVSNQNVVETCNDKWKSYLFLSKHDFNVPKSFLNIDLVHDKLLNKTIYFPLIIKPRWGMGSLGINKVDDLSELKVIYNKTKKDIKNSYLRFESQLDYSCSVIIQEFIEGQEYGLDVVNDFKGNYITTFTKRKLSMRSGETDEAVTIYNPQLETIGSLISIRLNHIGLIDVDCIISNSKIFVLEMNARIGGHYPFAHLAGANIAKVYIDWMDNKEPDRKHLQVKYGVKGAKDIRPIILKG